MENWFTEYLDKEKFVEILHAGFSIIILGILVLTAWMISNYLLSRLRHRLIREALEEKQTTAESNKRADTLVTLLGAGIKIILIVIFLLSTLNELGISLGPILASAGVVGLAVGFGAQSLVKDIIGGFFLILENQIRLGDVATINGTSGLVERIGFRTTILRDLSGTVHIFPNGSIDRVSNLTMGWSAYVMDIGVSYKEDVDQVIQIIKDTFQQFQQSSNLSGKIIGDIEVFGLDKFADSSLIIKCRIKTLPLSQWEIGREFQKCLKKRFDQEGIEIPFPHLSVYFGEASKPFLLEKTNTEGY